jgi:hypothetical protein
MPSTSLPHLRPAAKGTARVPLSMVCMLKLLSLSEEQLRHEVAAASGLVLMLYSHSFDVKCDVCWVSSMIWFVLLC